jgi:hypothetical protein
VLQECVETFYSALPLAKPPKQQLALIGAEPIALKESVKALS